MHNTDKDKVHPRTGHEGPEGKISSISTLSLTSVLKGQGVGQCHAPATLSLGKRPSTHCTGGWVGPMAGLDRCGKSHPHHGSIIRLSSLQ